MNQSSSRVTHVPDTEAKGNQRSHSHSVTHKMDDAQNGPLFENPFSIEDLAVFDDATMQRLLSEGGFGITLDDIAASLHGASPSLLKRIQKNVSRTLRSSFVQALRRPLSKCEVKAGQRRVLNGLFWELTYWKTPALYEELTEGEQLHPGIFQRLEPDLRGKMVVDVGAGSGRASFESLRYGAKLVYAVEPSPGLLHILQQKVTGQPASSRIIPCCGRFDQIPLPDNSVDVALSCSAFTAEPEQGGEPGLVELQRVTKPGGKIVLIWPRTRDYDWLAAHGFHYVALPVQHEMRVRFRSLQSALRCARRFYAHNRAVAHYIVKRRKPEVPFSVLGLNPPRDYCWLTVR
jgi:ubiquinone/menaquinone biosynthesis C-methylase UbiE